jgi:hypothetical protein
VVWGAWWPWEEHHAGTAAWQACGPVSVGGPP